METETCKHALKKKRQTTETAFNRERGSDCLLDKNLKVVNLKTD